MPRVFFHTAWSHIDPHPKAGGPKVGQQHVKILRENGIDARFVLGGKRRFSRMSSHEKAIAVRPNRFADIVTDEDVVVVAAVNSHRLDSIPGRRKILMVQNGGLLFKTLPGDVAAQGGEAYPWHRPSVEGIICVSERDRELLRLVKPAGPIYRVYNAVQPRRFRPLPWEQREDLLLASPLLAYKNPYHVSALFHMIRSRALAPKGNGAAPRNAPTVRVIQGLEPPEVEQLLPRAKALIFLSVNEGFPLLPLEALLSETPVIGYENQAFGEVMPGEYLHGVSDFEGMVAKVEKILEMRPDDPWHDIRFRARDRALEYSLERQERSVLETWTRILA